MKTILTLLLTLIPMFTFAQNAKIANFADEGKFVVIDVLAKSDEYKNIKIYLKGRRLSDFIHELKDQSSKILKWSNTAHEKSVTDFEKSIDGALSFSYMTFEYGGKSYQIEGREFWKDDTYNDYSYKHPYIKEKFYIDKNGNCFLNAYSIMDPQKFDYDNISVETTSKGEIVNLGSDLDNDVSRVRAKSESKQRIELQPNFNLYVPSNKLQSFIEELQNCANQLKSDKKEQKEKNKLFK